VLIKACYNNFIRKFGGKIIMYGLIITALQFILGYINTQILIKKRPFSIIQVILVIISSVLIGLSFLVIGVYGSIFMVLGIFLLNYYHNRNLIGDIGITSYGVIILVISDHLSSFIEGGVPPLSAPNYFVVVHMSLHFLISILLSTIISYCKDVFKSKKSMDKKSEVFISLMGLITISVYYLCIFLGVYLGNSIELIQLNLLFFIVYLLLTIIIFYFYSESLRKSYQIKQKETEYEAMQMYMEEIESRYTDIRKFRHDYQNILCSLNTFIEENDFNGLREYYYVNIKKTSRYLDENNFKLENLSKLKVKEMKSIIATKLIFAQELGIDATFEARDEIHKIDLDSVTTVRIMGILIDNAIEELQEIKSGFLKVGIIQDAKSVQIIVQNTCRAEIPRVHKLKQAGFTTKGKNRGLGLSIVTELIQKLHNVIAETIIDNEMFTQIIIVNEME
jgi:two-component system sensor histidine kinase AgrC